MRKVGSILPQGNEAEFDDIRTELRRCGVTWYERSVHTGNGTVFWFFELEVSKLPTDPESQGSSEFAQYLPAGEDSGFTISVLDQYLERFPGEDICCPA